MARIVIIAILVLSFIISLAQMPAHASESTPRSNLNTTPVIQLSACLTILDALYKDWQSTDELFKRGLGHLEINPVIRIVGPAPYFGVLMIGAATFCNESRDWKLSSIIIFIVQTVAVNTHVSIGTAIGGVPLMYFTVQW